MPELKQDLTMRLVVQVERKIKTAEPPVRFGGEVKAVAGAPAQEVMEMLSILSSGVFDLIEERDLFTRMEEADEGTDDLS